MFEWLFLLTVINDHLGLLIDNPTFSHQTTVLFSPKACYPILLAVQ